MSANLIVDLGNTAQLALSIGLGGAGSGIIYPASGAVIGQSVSLRNANTFCNLIAGGNAVFPSGQLRLQVQCSDTDTSGNFTDPTSGLPVMPTSFSSGGIVFINSGGTGGSSGGVLGGFVSGQATQSGWLAAAGFQRPFEFARVNVLSGDFYAGTLLAGFVSQLRTTGSGGGFSLAPPSGSVNV